jgi:hypothetical protein
LLSAPIRFIAIASAPWASGDKDPRDMAAVEKRGKIERAGSTSSMEEGGGVEVADPEQVADR